MKIFLQDVVNGFDFCRVLWYNDGKAELPLCPRAGNGAERMEKISAGTEKERKGIFA